MNLAPRVRGEAEYYVPQLGETPPACLKVVGALAVSVFRVPLMMLIMSWSAMLETWPLLAFNCPGSRAVRDHSYSSDLARLAVHHGRDAGSRIGWPSQNLYWSGHRLACPGTFQLSDQVG